MAANHKAGIPGAAEPDKLQPVCPAVLGQRERALTDGTFRAQVVAETRAWFDAHPEEAQGIVELFAAQATA